MDEKAQLERRVQQLEQRLAALEHRFGTTPLRSAVEAEVVDQEAPAAPPRGESDDHHRRRAAALGRFLESQTHDAPPLPPPMAIAPPLAASAPAFQMQPPGASFPHAGLAAPAPSAPPGGPISPSAHLAPMPATAPSAHAPPQIPPPLPYQPQRPPPPALRQGHLEQTIGLKWAGWVGALVVVFGAALGVKYAYDAGWIGKLPPELRLFLMALGGFSLIAAGKSSTARSTASLPPRFSARASPRCSSSRTRATDFSMSTASPSPSASWRSPC